MSGLLSALRRSSLIATALLAACHLPQDPERTLDQVREAGAFRVGLVAGSARHPSERVFLDEVSRIAQARPAIEFGSAEALLARLEQGEIDLVLGEFRADTPWTTRVTMIPKLKGDEVVTAAAAQNGENAWIMLLQSASTGLGQPR